VSCEFIRSQLTCAETLAVVEPFFAAARETFIAYEMQWRGSSRMRKVRLECAPEVHDTARHFAGTTEDGRSILVTPELAELPEETVAAILTHEFGHAMDFAYPAVFRMAGDTVVPVERVPDSDKRSEQAAIAAMRQWRDRDDDRIERTADAIAELVTGRSLGYAGPCLLQTFGAGQRPRPAGLR
jgi:hypothetical protein